MFSKCQHSILGQVCTLTVSGGSNYTTRVVCYWTTNSDLEPNSHFCTSHYFEVDYSSRVLLNYQHSILGQNCTLTVSGGSNYTTVVECYWTTNMRFWARIALLHFELLWTTLLGGSVSKLPTLDFGPKLHFDSFWWFEPHYSSRVLLNHQHAILGQKRAFALRTTSNYTTRVKCYRSASIWFWPKIALFHFDLLRSRLLE